MTQITLSPDCPRTESWEATSGPVSHDVGRGQELPLVLLGQGIFIRPIDVTPMRSPFDMLRDAKDWGLWQLARFICWAIERD